MMLSKCDCNVNVTAQCELKNEGYLQISSKKSAFTGEGFKTRTKSFVLQWIVNEVAEEMQRSMKAKDSVTLQTVRLIRISVSNSFSIDLKTEDLSYDQAQIVQKKMANMRKESIKLYEKGGAIDRATEERNELAILEIWIPELVSKETVRAWVVEAIDEAGKENIGKVRGALMNAHTAEVDGTSWPKTK